MAELPKLVTPMQLTQECPGLKLRTLRYWIQHAEPRLISRGGRRISVPGNGLAPALIRKGRVTLIDVSRFSAWLEEGRCG